MVRQPAVAGRFYNDIPEQLRLDLGSMIEAAPVRQKAIGIVAPHAGYMFSGGVAGKVYGVVEVPRHVIVLGPNHHGHGAAAALSPQREWLTPLGTVPISNRLAELVKKHSPLVKEDSAAHRFEHSLEVQLPFLQYLRPDLEIVPLCLGFGDFSSCRELGEGIAKAVREFGEDVLIVASSDMTHYEPVLIARQKDELALREVMALNPEGLLQVCRSERITMCGVVPTTVMLVAALGLGASRAELVHYATSGDVTGDNRQVVAYAAMTVA